jgi:hypothetical protein
MARSRLAISTAALGAVRPLLMHAGQRLIVVCRRSGCRWRSESPLFSCTSISARQESLAHDFEVIGIAADDCAERDQRIEAIRCCAIVCSASGISRAPGHTWRCVMLSQFGRRRGVSVPLVQALSRPSPMSWLKRLMTMPTCQAVAGERRRRTRGCFRSVPSERCARAIFRNAHQSLSRSSGVAM